MKKAFRGILLILALILASNLGFAQGKEIRIKFIGNCGLYMTDGETNIYSDFPYKSGAFNYMEFDAWEENFKLRPKASLCKGFPQRGRVVERSAPFVGGGRRPPPLLKATSFIRRLKAG